MSNLRDLIAPACEALNIDPLAQGLQLLDARALIAPARLTEGAPGQSSTGNPQAALAWSEIQGVGPYAAPLLPFPLLPARPALLCRLDTANAHEIAATLQTRYPSDYLIALVRVGPQPQVWHARLSELGSQPLDAATCAYLAPLAPLDDLRGAEGPALVVARLLGPYGCPWDREQTHRSLRSELLEEAHEVLEALDAGDTDALSEELGDLLLQVLMHSEMARQAGAFDLGAVYEQIAAKLIRRHPHIFGDVSADDTGTVLRNWDAIKQQERAAKGQAPRGALDGVPVGIPALAAAQELTRKAAKVGFDAPDADLTWAKLHEEIAEVQAAAAAPPDAPERQAQIEEELGDLLQITAKLAWKLGIDAESALRAANAKFRRRFSHVEQLAATQERTLKDMSIAERQALWEQAKQQ